MYNYRQPYSLCLSVSLSLCRYFSKCLRAFVPSLSLCLFVSAHLHTLRTYTPIKNHN
jgi:hypothetical protein